VNDEANERLATVFDLLDDLSKTLARQGVPSGRPLHSVSGAPDLATERGDMSDSIEAFPRPTRAEPRGEFPRHGDRVGRVLTGPEALAIARKRLADWIAENPDCQLVKRKDHDGDEL